MKSGFEFVILSVWTEENEEQGKDKLGSKRNEGGSDPSATKRVSSPEQLLPCTWVPSEGHRGGADQEVP